VTGTTLHLVEPLGFSLDERQLKRAGLDYWQFLKLQVHRSLDDFLVIPKDNFWLFTTKGNKNYTEIEYQPDDFLIFGKETAGLPPGLLLAHPQRCVRIPMGQDVRSLNLSNAVAVVLYEALRQQGFPGMV
jgi:tRNA (cytidine/uridine-2'-O-)-methyltransferase